MPVQLKYLTYSSRSITIFLICLLGAYSNAAGYDLTSAGSRGLKRQKTVLGYIEFIRKEKVRFSHEDKRFIYCVIIIW